jgi:DNA-binding transcriptional regulator YhcF (GntR family)
MTLALRVDAQNPTPPYEQLHRQLATAIAFGALAAGTRLPSVRQLAADLGIAAGTVMRAYSELESRGLVATRRGGGTTVAKAPRVLSPEERQRSLDSQVAAFLAQARLLGVTDEAVGEAVERALGTEGQGPDAWTPKSMTPPLGRKGHSEPS